MRPNTTTEILAALEAAGITTAIMGRFDFQSETVNVWTGSGPVTVTGSADTMLNNQTFQPLVHGVVLNIGDNNFTTTGSDSMKIALALPSAPSAPIAAASVIPDEYRGRTATLWRALMIASPTAGAPASWAFRRIRAGSMDTVEISNDGVSHTFTLGIESHSSLISSATQSTYMDQKRFDPADQSQVYVAACANGSPAPAAPSNSGGLWGALQGRLTDGPGFDPSALF